MAVVLTFKAKEKRSKKSIMIRSKVIRVL